MMLAFLEPFARYHPAALDRSEKHDRKTRDEMRFSDLMTLVDRSPKSDRDEKTPLL